MGRSPLLFPAVAPVALVLVAALAGCLEPAGSAEVVTASQAGLNVLRGVVVDPAFSPVAGANVTLHGLDVTAVTSGDGAFAFSRVPDGEHLVIVRAEGFEGRVQRASALGGSVQDLRVVLSPLPVEEPYFEAVEKRGFVSCGAAARTSEETSESVTCGEDNPNDKRDLLFEIPVGDGVAGIVLELVWTAQNPGARVMWFRAEQPDPADPEKAEPLAAAEGSGHVSILIPKSVAEAHYGKGGVLRTLVEPAGSFFDHESPTDAALVLNQDYTVYATVFYHAPPPPGFSVLDG